MEYTYIGILDKKIADYWEISEHANKPILVYKDRRQHVIDNHLKDFVTIEAIDKVVDNFVSIIKKPDYVYYNNETKGLEYYKKLDNDVCVAVRINSGKVLKVKSWYPTSNSKIINRRRKEIEIKVICE